MSKQKQFELAEKHNVTVEKVIPRFPHQDNPNVEAFLFYRDDMPNQVYRLFNSNGSCICKIVSKKGDRY